MKLGKSEEITDILTPKGIEELKVGQILRFQKDGQTIELKITKKAKGRLWAAPTMTFGPTDLVVTHKKNIFGRRRRETIEEFINKEGGDNESRV
ncbi:MAG: hypothetical protein Q8910_01565 [Bacteroidota bacterium]|nr:hypothetical protein [Bacteroidota bacterium]